MISQSIKEKFKKQHYGMVGGHSAVKICGWTKGMIKNEGGCYKLKFYGIMSHQCLQMTTSLSCANRCVFCWRDYKEPVSKEWKGCIDEPEFILNESLKAQEKLLVGIKGAKKANRKLYNESKDVKHVALSLTGEPIIYPKINEIIKKFHERNISTFLVTNAQYPEAIKTLSPITQLYLSVDAPNKKLLKEIDKPLFEDYWERLNKSLEYLSEKKQRTCIRLTLIKEINMTDLESYAGLIKKGNPNFIEAKGYIHVGAAARRLERRNMPYHEDVVSFSKELVKYLPEYEIVSEHISSRVVMLAKKKFKKEGKWFTWIDFDKFNELALSGKEYETEDYIKMTPEGSIGLSGKGSLDREDSKFRHKTPLSQLVRMEKS